VTKVLRTLIDDMLETMYEAPGIGLAAPQVARSVCLIVVDIRPRDMEGRYELGELTELEQKVKFPLVFFNPKILKKEGKTTYQEGCLSVPTYFENVERAQYIEAEGLDREGHSLTIKTDGLLAICIQHEIDHLNGKLFVDYLSEAKRQRIRKKLEKDRRLQPAEAAIL